MESVCRDLRFGGLRGPACALLTVELGPRAGVGI